MVFGDTSPVHRPRSSTPSGPRAFTILALALLVGCQGNDYRVTRGCGSSGERTPDTSSPVRQRTPPRASDEGLSWEALLGESPRTFDASGPVEPPETE
jgi:hypothetical protein